MEPRTKKPLLGASILLIATVIWGLAYIAQSKAMAYLGVFSFTAVRILLGGIVLTPIALLRFGRSPALLALTPTERKRVARDSVIGGIVCGFFMGGAATLQQFGLALGSAGKAGFLTALYIVLVPVFGVLFRRHIRWLSAVSVGIALIGSYFLCVKGGFSIALGDWLLIGNALLYAFQILFIDFYMERGADPVLTTCVEFLFAGICLSVLAALFDPLDAASVWAARYTILYAGVVSGALGFTLQMIGQREMEPTAASLLMSLESVFAALFGWLLLGERMSGRELFGCALVFAAVILSQLPIGRKRAS